MCQFKFIGKTYIYIYLGTPKGHNFSLKRQNRLLGSQAEILV